MAATFSPLWKDETFATHTITTSMADGAAYQTDGIDNSASGQDAFGYKIAVDVTTTTTAGSATGYIDVYVSESVDAETSYAGEVPSGGEGALTSTTITLAERFLNMKFLGRMNVPADDTTAFTFNKVFDYPWAAEWFKVIISNQTGAALATTAGTVKTHPYQSQSA